MNYILRIYGVSFLKISAFLISYSTYFIELVPTSSHCFFFFFPVPCLYSLNKTCLNLQYYLLSLVLKPWQYKQSIQVLTLSLWCPVLWVNECQWKFSGVKGRTKQEKMLLPGWMILSYSILVPLLRLYCCALEVHLKKMQLWLYRLSRSPPPSQPTLQCASCRCT